MPTYAFHHYGRSDTAICVTFGSFSNDEGAFLEARRVLDFDALRRVDICHDLREVGSVHPLQAPLSALASNVLPDVGP